jgi:hypothetical protein
MFDSRMPHVEGGSGSVFVVRSYVCGWCLKLGWVDRELYVRLYGSRFMIRDVGGYQWHGPPFGRCVCCGR